MKNNFPLYKSTLKQSLVIYFSYTCIDLVVQHFNLLVLKKCLPAVSKDGQKIQDKTVLAVNLKSQCGWHQILPE